MAFSNRFVIAALVPFLLAACSAPKDEQAAEPADRVFVSGAYQMKLDDVQGSIEVGKRADPVVLDRNLFEIPASETSDAQVVMTIFDGRTVFE
ncbi:MAG: amidohydrolase family protein [Woeseiaceae bacterium]|nr:amidohydrolase family protein [Woeseiaceae bacterium]